ncbi:MAG: tyrosine-type recombinase/integrase [Bryobacteraceae bacterium]
MSVYRPQYRDRKTGKLRHTKIWYYEFIFAGRLVKESAKTRSKTVAREAEKQRRRELEEGFNGISDRRDQRIRTLRGLAQTFLEDYKVRQPKSACFAEHAIGHVERLLGECMAVDISDKTILKYQTDRLTEGAAPKTINDEVGFLLRLLNVAQGGAIRAQLRQQKKLKLKMDSRVGKAYSTEEKTGLVTAAKAAPRSKSIYFATMLAQHAALRDKEIRTMQWNGLNLTKRMLTVGQSKTNAGTGRTIPMNDELFAAAVEYAKWYAERFKTSKPEWYVFPFGRPRPTDPTRHQTSMKTAWRNVRTKAKVTGRFHDNRHTFVTDLAEGGASDQMIQDLAGHVSPQMVKHYSHMRTEAKRRAVGTLATPGAKPDHVQTQPKSPNCEGVPQDIPQVTAVN